MCFHEMRRADGSALMLNLAPSPSRGHGLMERRDRQTYRPELASSNIAFDRTGTSTPYCTPYPDHEGRMRTPMERHLIVTAALTALLAACSEHTAPSALNGPRAGVVETRLGQNVDPNRPGTTVIVYDDFHKPGGYTLADYNAKWSVSLGEMAIQDTRQFDNHTLSIAATPFRTGADASVADHGKYTAISKQGFAVPAIGSITVSIDIEAETPGTIYGHSVHGTYVQSGAPYAAKVLQGQQAAVTLHMIDFATGQLFDWFVSGNTAVPLIERLPSSVSGSAEHVSTYTMYTQITDAVPIAAAVPHTVAILYSRHRRRSRAADLPPGSTASP